MRRIYIGLSIATGLIFAAMALAAQTPASPHVAMPAGHPDISAMMDNSGKPTTQPAGRGIVSVRIVQKTPGVPAVGVIPFNIELVHHEQVMTSIPGQTDARGVAIVTGIPVELPVVPRVVVNYKGMNFSAIGERELSPTSRFQDIGVPVYEVSDQAPAWTVQIRHVAFRRDEKGRVVVSDVFGINNPTDYACKSVTLDIPLPTGVTSARLGEDAPEGTDVQVKDDVVHVKLPLLPGDTHFYLLYDAKEADGKIHVAFKAPRQVAMMKTMVPQQVKVEVDGLRKSQSERGQMLEQDMYEGANLPAGHLASVTIWTQAQSANASGGFASTPKLIAVIGGGLILVIGAAIMLMKGKKSALDDAHRPRG